MSLFLDPVLSAMLATLSLTVIFTSSAAAVFITYVGYEKLEWGIIEEGSEENLQK